MKWSKYRKSTGQMRDKIRNANVFWFTLRFHSHHIYAICIISFIYRCQTLFVEAHKYMAGTLCVYHTHARTRAPSPASNRTRIMPPIHFEWINTLFYVGYLSILAHTLYAIIWSIFDCDELEYGSSKYWIKYPWEPSISGMLYAYRFYLSIPPIVYDANLENLCNFG